MIDMFLTGGPLMWPLLVIAIAIVVMAVREAFSLRSHDPGLEPGRRATTILFWGAMSLLLGVTGTVVGLVDMSRKVQRAGAISDGLAWGGVGLSLSTTLFGLLVCLLAGGLWLGLRMMGSRTLPKPEAQP